MKTLIQCLITISLILTQSHSVFADSAGNAAGAILVSFAAAKGMQSIAVNALERLELDEWKDERSLTTAILGDTCGFYYEARIIGDVRNNYLWLTLKNNNPTQRSFNPIEVEFNFSSGIERRPDLFRFNEVFFEPGRLYNMILPFPAKEDFKNQQSLDALVPFSGDGKKCNIPIRLVRNPKMADTIRGTVSMSVLEMDLSYGASYISGNLADVIGKNRSVMSFNYMLYGPYGPYGGGLYFGFRSYDQGQLTSTAAAQEAYQTSWRAQVGEYYLGYVHRFIFTQDATAFIRGGIGGATLSISDDANSNQGRFSASILDLQMGYQRIFNRVKAGIWTGNYFWGVTITDSLMSGKEVMKNGTKYDGNAASALLSIGVGI